MDAGACDVSSCIEARSMHLFNVSVTTCLLSHYSLQPVSVFLTDTAKYFHTIKNSSRGCRR